MSNIFDVGRGWSVEAESGLVEDSELRVTLLEDPPYIWIYPMPDGSYRYDGYLYDVWKAIAQALNLRYRMVPLPGRDFGRIDENGTWTGLVGELAYGRADVALTWLWMREDRLKVIDYLDVVPVEQTSMGFFIRKDMGDAQGFSGAMISSLLKPLEMNVWWMLLGILLVLSLVLKGTARLCRTEDGQAASEPTWAMCLLSTFRCLTGQGWPSMPSSLSGRTVTIISWFLCVIIHTSYTANLISYLTIMTVDRPIKSLKDFSERPDWMLVMNPNHIVLNDWRVSKDKYERELYQRVLNRDRFIPFDDPEKRACELIKPKILAYLPKEQLFYVLGSDVCGMVPLYDQPLQGMNNYIPIAKKLRKLRRAMNEILQKMNEAGILKRLKKRWLEHHHMCASRAAVEPLSFGNALPVLMIVPMGFAASCAICGLELMFNRVTKRGR